MGQAFRLCRGSCSPIPGRGCFGDIPWDRIVVSPPPPIVETLNDDFLRDLRNYTSVVDHPGRVSTDHVTASRRSENTLMAELLGRISAITRRDLLEDGVLPGEVSPTEKVPQGGVLERPEQPTSPADGPVEAPLAGSSSLQQYGQSRHRVTPAVTSAGNAALPSGSVVPTTLLISRRSPPTARCPSSGDWDYIPRHCSRMSCV